MSEVLDNPRVAIGDNNPPALTPYEIHKINIDDLMETAQGFLDGDPITTQAMADEVGKLLDEARKAEKAADEQRKAEAKPFDDGKKAVQELWNPLCHEKTGKCALIAATAKKALAPFLLAEQKRKDEEAAEAQRIADAKIAEAQAAMRVVEVTDLAGRAEAEALVKAADKAVKAADTAGKQKAMAAGGSRSVSLRSVWTAALADPVAALRHYRERQPEDMKAWLSEQATRDVAAGVRAIPGFTITEEKVAQ